MLRIEYDHKSRQAVLSWDKECSESEWVRLLRYTLHSHTEDAEDLAYNVTALPWWSLLTARHHLKEILGQYAVELDVGDDAAILLKKAISNEIRYKDTLKESPVPSEDIKNKLAAVGFARQLKTEQMRNVCKIGALSAAASFSVPGAGKTTEALAYYFYRSTSENRLLIVAPKNAFGAWDEQIEECMEGVVPIARLRGGRDRIQELLEEQPRFSIITYQQLNTVNDLVSAFVAEAPTFLFLDESHRIKGGIKLRTAASVLGLSHLPVSKLILSGTPMPQSDGDLIPQFTFLYPEITATEDNVVELMKPVYVRTTKHELQLPPIIRVAKTIEMSETQEKLYNLMKFELVRQVEKSLSRREKSMFRKLGKSIMRMLAFVSNPALLAREIDWIDSDYLEALLEESPSGPKVDYACNRARELALEGKKVLIWTSFVQNVEIIAERLSDLGAVFIHGGVDSGLEEDDDTREGKIRLFRDDPSVQVMVANPAAASEGISLHMVCRYAIYVDRTYNAAHYLQSEDRIHRLGLRPDQSPIIEVLECPNTIDESVRDRLCLKVDRMAQALEDESLNIDPIPLDPAYIEDSESYALGLDDEDLMSLLQNLKG